MYRNVGPLILLTLLILDDSARAIQNSTFSNNTASPQSTTLPSNLSVNHEIRDDVPAKNLSNGKNSSITVNNATLIQESSNQNSSKKNNTAASPSRPTRPPRPKPAYPHSIVDHGNPRNYAKPARKPFTLRPKGMSQKKQYACVVTVPRLNLDLSKMLGEWYPAKLSQTTRKLWVQSFRKSHENNINVTDDSCFLTEYKVGTNDSNDEVSLDIILHKQNESTEVEALLIGDENHPKGSIWAISWPNGEDTLTSVVAAGVVGGNKSRYNWLVTVDCDLNGIVEPDWAVMARVAEGISNSTLSAILMIMEGFKGLTIEDAITYQPDDCH